MKSVCFTGHRNIPDSFELVKHLRQVLESLIAQGYTDFYAGGALGWDMLCEQIVLVLRRHKYPQIRLHLVLPCPPAEQTMKWTDTQKTAYSDILSQADSVEQICAHYQKDCMKQRNARLVEHADYCVCYYVPVNCRSGTGQTIRMAQKKGVPVHNLAEITVHP